MFVGLFVVSFLHTQEPESYLICEVNSPENLILLDFCCKLQHKEIAWLLYKQ